MNEPVLSVAESRAAYLRRPQLVVDSSVLVAVLFEEAASGAALALLRGRSLVAPWLLDFEIASVAQKKLRREGRSLAEVDAVLGTFMELPIQRMAIPATASLALAERYGLTCYDAAYLWLAEAIEAPLATFDGRLGSAARQHLAGDQGH